ncbi:unnamed protein product [Cladocopium goreaui]|uniref:Bifunctional lysine-specific demethylase and histidyl-hydroxylase NO66 n=1 Tax=Cladocopium goreaui TaxID=2562237 RepID=A0A9P1BQI6_9DINO|nr:unnamed protein product [Cladocopium goreaui]
MRSLADHAPAAADATGDFLAAQFVARRLPPRPTVLPSPPSHRKLALRWVDPTAVRVVVESRPGQEAEIQIYHTMENVASSHMHPDLEPQPACIVLEGMEYLPALQALNRANGAWVLASSLGSADLVEGLLEHGLLEIGDADLCEVKKVSTLQIIGVNGVNAVSGKPSKKLKGKASKASKASKAGSSDSLFGRSAHRSLNKWIQMGGLRGIHGSYSTGSSGRRRFQLRCCCCWDKDEDSMSDWSDSDSDSSYESVEDLPWSPGSRRLPTYSTPKPSTLDTER